MAYITFFDLLGTRGFCDNSEEYYNNICLFKKAITQTSTLLIDYGNVGVFSDSAYATSTSLKHMLDFLVSLRNRLMSNGLFFNAVVKLGNLGIESINSPASNVFGVAFKNSDIADLYIAQTKFKGIGINIDDSIPDKEILDAGYEINHCVFVGRSSQSDTVNWHPVPYRDISLKESIPSKNQQSISLEILLRTFYSSYMKAPKYGAYYISILCNYIRSFGINLKWDLVEKKYETVPLIFAIIEKMAKTEYETFSMLPGFDYLIFTMLDMVYASSTLYEQDKVSITKEYAMFDCMRKYLHDLNSIPSGIFSNDGRARFTRYCQEDFANEFIEKML